MRFQLEYKGIAKLSAGKWEKGEKVSRVRNDELKYTRSDEAFKTNPRESYMCASRSPLATNIII